MRFRRAVACCLFLATVLAWAQKPSEVAAKPVSERQLLCWIIAGVPTFNLQYELEARGVDFAADPVWLENLKQAGADEQLLAAVEKARTAPGASVQPDEFSSKLFRVMKEENAKKFSAATLHLVGLAKMDKTSPDLLFALGGFMNRQEEWGEAIAVLTESLTLTPDSVYAHEQLSYAYYRMEIAESAIKEAKAALVIRANDPDAHKFLGLAYLARRDFEHADKELNEALKLKPDYANVYGDLALSLSLRGQDLAALPLYRRAMELDPKDSHLFYNAGSSYARAHQTQDAIAAYKQAEALDPDDLRIRQNLGATYCDAGRYEEAVTEFQNLLAIDPDWNMARVCLIRSLRRLGRGDEADAVRAEYYKRGGRPN
jgi:tetratricopeptide (TPR) repeat protein